MGRVVKILGGEGGFFPQDYKLDATCVSGALAVRSTGRRDHFSGREGLHRRRQSRCVPLTMPGFLPAHWLLPNVR